MNIDEAIQKMINSSDYEVVFMGEQFWWHKDSYVAELMRLGFCQKEAEKGLARFCNAVMADVEHGREVSFPDYKDDLVAMIAPYCRSGAMEAA